MPQARSGSLSCFSQDTQAREIARESGSEALSASPDKHHLIWEVVDSSSWSSSQGKRSRPWSLCLAAS